jgi:hypothetical protein
MQNGENKTPTVYEEKDALAVGLPSVESLKILKHFAQELVGTPFLPKGLVRLDENGHAVGNPAGAILAVILTGREMGMQAMQALRSFWISPDGRLAMYSESMLGRMRQHGFKVQWLSDTSAKCEAVFTRPDGDTYTSTFTIEEARQAGLIKDRGNWEKYPKAMLRARVIATAWRVLAGDISGGVAYAKEEIEDLDNGGAPVIEVPETEDFKKLVGRKAATAVPTPEPEVKPEPAKPATTPETPPQTNPPEEPEKPVAVKTPSPAPKPVTTAKTEPPPPPLPTEEQRKEQMALRMTEAKKAVGGMPRAAAGTVNNFLRGFLGLEKDARLSNTDIDLYNEPMAALEKALVSQRAELVENPYRLGLQLSGRKGELDSLLESWPWMNELMRTLARKAYNAGDFRSLAQFEMFIKANELHTVNENDATHFLRIATVSKAAAGHLTTMAEQYGLSVTSLSHWIDQQLKAPAETFPQEKLEEYVELLKRRMEEQAAKMRTEEPAPQESTSQEGLPFEDSP